MIPMEKFKQMRAVHLCIALTFFTSGLIINIVQAILHFCLKPFDKRLFRSWMYYLCYSLYSQLIFVTDWYSGSKLQVFIDDNDEKNYIGKEHALLIMNHTYEIDWLVGWMFTEKCGVLGNCKAYAKKVIGYIPVIGWAWKFAEFVFLERSYEKDKNIINAQLKEIFAYPDPVWLLLNAEGTRFTKEKQIASIKFAQENKLKPLKYHLIPRTKGFVASLPSLRTRCPAIYDINLAFKSDSPVTPTISSLLNGYPVYGYMFVRRIPLDSVPESDDKAAEWLQNLFQEKDRIQESFHTTGSFFTTSGFSETKSRVLNRRLRSLVNFSFWALLSVSSTSYFLISSLILQNWFGLIVCVGLLLLMFVLMEKAIGMSEIRKGSSYGMMGGSGNKIIINNE